MKLQDLDSLHEYNATKRLGNPDTPAAGDAKLLRETMHNSTPTFSTLDEKKMYDELVANLSDSLVSVEGLLPANKVVEAFQEVIQEQVDYHTKQLDYYQIISDCFR
jgi:regulator of sirC expression with transglutaminase-like and TPR domain